MAAIIQPQPQAQPRSKAQSADDVNVRPAFSDQNPATGQEKPASFSLPLSEQQSSPQAPASGEVITLLTDSENGQSLLHDGEGEDASAELTADALTNPGLMNISLTGNPVAEVTAFQSNTSDIARLQSLAMGTAQGTETLKAAETLKTAASQPESMTDRLALQTSQPKQAIQLKEVEALAKGHEPLSSTASAKINELFSARADTQQTGVASLSTESATTHVLSAASGTTNTAAAGKPTWANIQVDTTQGKWGEQMIQVLQDRVSMQAGQKMQEAHIRLDPPDLGKLELLVKVDGDKLNVQINANHAQVREALVQVSERLRNELQTQQFVHVDVNVGTDNPQHSASQQPNQEEDEGYQVTATNVADSEDTARSHSSEYWLSTSA